MKQNIPSINLNDSVWNLGGTFNNVYLCERPEERILDIVEWNRAELTAQNSRVGKSATGYFERVVESCDRVDTGQATGRWTVKQ